MVRARIDPIGESNAIALTINHNIATASGSSYSANGAQVKITGSGFPSTWPNKHYNKISLVTGVKSLPLDIVSMTPTQIVLNLPRAPLNSGRTYTFTIVNSMGTSKSIGLSQSASTTPTVNLVSSAIVAPNTVTNVILSRTNMNTTYPEIIQLYSVSNP